VAVTAAFISMCLRSRQLAAATRTVRCTLPAMVPYARLH
jgi:hypothetical protein